MFQYNDAAGSGKFQSSACAAAILSAVAILPGAVSAQTDCSFFSGQTVELVVPFNPGGGFDAYGRLVAKYMGPILGADSMIVRNQPGAGGMLATNQTWAADPDGLMLQVMSTSGMLTAELGGAAGVGFESAEFSWIGRVSGEPDVVAVGFGSDIASPEAIQAISAERPVRIGSSGVGDIDYIEAQILTKVFDLDSNIVVGFSGAPEVYSSLARGELDLFTSSYSGARQAAAAESASILWLFDDNADPDFPDLTPIGEYLEGDNLALVKAHADLVAGGRAIAGPPGIPEDRLTCLRDAFDATVVDEAFLAESAEINRPVAPISGADLQETIVSLTGNVPQDYADLLIESYSN
ncbi:Bug family tripartite tricarboxylate transporter substrate binding protein [Roseisalinus antarcticus]|uniref:Tripartite tricarboxylate transporter family receptor n=1 Tax=Roseisalinus antarcticus TaxID=254357 RepID=A0A1Y5T9Q2_9RHOB|nr:tripartite tricarboxylate transporter substrate-binding protein [Roseisalinus antarcticus]SLN57197.1 Tripartite tricarboxylate transporter family receptor [Roseisalinus antarcticus]